MLELELINLERLEEVSKLRDPEGPRELKRVSELENSAEPTVIETLGETR